MPPVGSRGIAPPPCKLKGSIKSITKFLRFLTYCAIFVQTAYFVQKNHKHIRPKAEMHQVAYG